MGTYNRACKMLLKNSQPLRKMQ